MAATMTAYLEQLAVSSRPATVEAASLALRQFAAHVTRTDPTCVSVSAIERRHVESYKVALVARPGREATRRCPPRPSATTSGCCARSSSGSSTPTTPTHPAGSRSSPATCPRPTSRSPSSSTTPPRPSSWPRWPPTPTGDGGSWSSSWPARACAPASSPRWRRRHVPARRHLLAPHPPREAPQRPNRPPPPDARRSHQRLPGLAGTLHHRAARRTKRPPALRPAHHPPLRRGRRPTRRDRPRAPSRLAPHPGDPVHQPGHVSRSHRRPVGPPLTPHDPRLRPHRRHRRRRAVLQRHPRRRGRTPAVEPAQRPIRDEPRIVASSATATAPDPSNSTAGSRPSARAAGSTRPAPSSSPSSDANATTPPTTPTSRAPSSTTSSCASSTNEQGAADSDTPQSRSTNSPTPWFHEHSPRPRKITRVTAHDGQPPFGSRPPEVLEDAATDDGPGAGVRAASSPRSACRAPADPA